MFIHASIPIVDTDVKATDQPTDRPTDGSVVRQLPSYRLLNTKTKTTASPKRLAFSRVHVRLVVVKEVTDGSGGGGGGGGEEQSTGIPFFIFICLIEFILTTATTTTIMTKNLISPPSKATVL